MRVTLKIWRQKNCNSEGSFHDYYVESVSPDMSFLEMLDVLNLDLIKKGEEPIVFDHDCREGICGMCSMVINGAPHGPQKLTTTCQLHMRKFSDGDLIVVEPFRAKAFPIIRDLMVDRSAFDKIISKGGYVSVNTGNVCDANSLPVSKVKSELAFNSAACIGCGACVASCKNSSAALFVGAKVAHLKFLPQGEPEAHRRVLRMVTTMDQEGFGSCSNTKACEANCPKGITVEVIAKMNREFFKASLFERHK